MASYSYSLMKDKIHSLLPHLSSDAQRLLFAKYRRDICAEPGTLNGQQERERIINDLIAVFQPTAVVETGTYLGGSTKFFVEHTQAPVYTCEINGTYYDFSKERFKNEKRVTLFKGESTDMLRELPGQISREAPVLFYLDAHWEENLPLRNEIHMIMKRWPNAMIVVDDFAVPHDAGYKYDNYGPDKALKEEYLEGLPSDLHASLRVFYPTISSAKETGSKRGCCFLAAAGSKAEAILEAHPDLCTSAQSLEKISVSADWRGREQEKIRPTTIGLTTQ